MNKWLRILLFVAMASFLGAFIYTTVVPPTRGMEIRGTVASFSINKDEGYIPVYINEISRRYVDSGEKVGFMPGRITYVALPKDTAVQEIWPGTSIVVVCPAWDFYMWIPSPCYLVK